MCGNLVLTDGNRELITSAPPVFVLTCVCIVKTSRMENIMYSLYTGGMSSVSWAVGFWSDFRRPPENAAGWPVYRKKDDECSICERMYTSLWASARARWMYT
jgi:hypothetical protein